MNRLIPALLLMICIFPADDAFSMARQPKEPSPPASSVPSPGPAKLSLDIWDCYEMAMHRSEAVEIRREEIRRTRASFLKAAGAAIGDVDFVMTDFRQEDQGSGPETGGVGSTFNAARLRESRFEYSQPLFQGFRTLGAVTGAGSLREQRVGEWERSKQMLFMETVNSFYDYLKLTKDAEVISGILELYQDRIEDLKEWEEIGRSRGSEIATVRSRYENYLAILAETRGDLAVARNLLTFLIGVRVEPNELEEEKLPLEPEKDFDVLMLAGERPDVKAAREAVKTARGAVIVAQSDLWPHLSLDANYYEHREGFQSGITWDALFTFRVPLGKGGETVAEVMDAVSKWKQAKLNYSLTERTAQREIQDAYELWKSSLERYNSLQKAVQSAEETFNLQQEEYQRRLVTNLDVLEALQNFLQARLDANEAYYDVKKNYWALEVAKGECCMEVPV